MFDKGKFNKIVFFPPIIILVCFVIAGAANTEGVGRMMSTLLYWMADTFGWYLCLLTMILIAITLIFIIRRYGDIKIGGADAKPMYSRPQWLAMTICGGIGTGLLFWAMGEPLYHFATPPVGAGVEAFSREAAVYAVGQAMWDWGFTQYCAYAVPGVCWALLVHNKKLPLSFDALIEYIFRKPIPWLATVFRMLTVFCICGSVSNSMGVGLLQIGAGLEAVLGIPQGAVVWVVIAAIIACIFILSSLTGLRKGLARLSTLCMYGFMILLVYVLLVGDTGNILKLSTEAIGNVIDNMGTRTLVMNALAPEDNWYADWSVQYFASFIVYMPIFGMFFARMSKGRSVREFILMNVGVPVLFNWIWIGVFGSMTITMQYTGAVDIWSAVGTYGMQTTIFQILLSLPAGHIAACLFLVCIILSFCTCADPMSTALSAVCVNGLDIEAEPDKKVKIIIGLVITAVSLTSVISGGVTAIKGLFVLVGLIMSIPGIFCVVASFITCKRVIDEGNDGMVE